MQTKSLDSNWRCSHCHKKCDTLDHCLREYPDKKVFLSKAEMFDTKLKYKAIHYDLLFKVTEVKFDIFDFGLSLDNK